MCLLNINTKFIVTLISDLLVMHGSGWDGFLDLQQDYSLLWYNI